MKIAIVAPLATVAPHFETELELAQRHLDAGDRVEMLACTGALPCCDFNVNRAPLQCGSCVGRRKAGLQLLDRRIAMIPLASTAASEAIPPEVFASIDALKEFRYEQFDLGYAALSSLVSICRDPQPDLQVHRALLERLLRAALATYRQTQSYCRTRRPDRVYVFNGRFAGTRAVLRACQSLGINCWIHERGCDLNHFQVFENRLPHDIEYMQQRMRAAWQAAEANPNREAIASSWFTDREQRIERNWHSFVKDQTHGRLPNGWNPANRNITVFTSSEDEFVSIGDSWRNLLYADQASALRRIIADLPKLDDRVRLFVRVHPNLKDVTNDNVRALQQLSGPRVTVISPHDTIDSYELLRRSDTVVTFGSSTGIEAVYWGRPSVLLGACFYRGLKGVFQPGSHEQAITMLNTALEPASDKSGALMYGYWFQTHGEQFKYFEATGLFEGRFRGKIVFDQTRKPPLIRIAEKIKRWVRKRVA